MEDILLLCGLHDALDCNRHPQTVRCRRISYNIFQRKSAFYGLQNTVCSPHNTKLPFKMHTRWCSASQPHRYVFMQYCCTSDWRLTAMNTHTAVCWHLTLSSLVQYVTDAGLLDCVLQSTDMWLYAVQYSKGLMLALLKFLSPPFMSVCSQLPSSSILAHVLPLTTAWLLSPCHMFWSHLPVQLTPLSWRKRQRVHLTHWHLSNMLHTVTSQNTVPLSFRHHASCILGQAFHYSPENAFYIFNQQTYFIIWYLLDRASLI